MLPLRRLQLNYNKVYTYSNAHWRSWRAMSRCFRASILSAAGLQVALGCSELPMSLTLRCSWATSRRAAARVGEERLAGLRAEGSGACQGHTTRGVGGGCGGRTA